MERKTDFLLPNQVGYPETGNEEAQAPKNCLDNPALRRMLSNPQLLQRLLLAITCNLKSASCKKYFSQHPIAPTDMGKTQLAIDAFFTGAGWVTEYLWPLAYTVMFLTDLTAANTRASTNPELHTDVDLGRYVYDSTNPVTWLNGFSQNRELLDVTLTSNFGVSRPDTVSFWLVSSLFYVLPSIIGLINAAIVCSHSNTTPLNALVTKLPDLIADQDYGKQTTLDYSIINELAPALPYVWGRKAFTSENYSTLSRVIFLSSLDERLRGTNLLSTLSSENKNRTLLAIARTLSRASQPPTEKRKCVECSAWPAALYLQWSSGGDSKPKNRYFYLSIPLQWAFRYAYVRDFVFKAFIAISYYVAMQDCKNNGNFYNWYNQIGDYACFPTNMTSVDLKNRATTLGSLNRLLSEPRSALFLQTQLSYLLEKLNNVTQIDLSKQNWTSWTGKTLTKIFNHTLTIAPELKSLNLSTPAITQLNNAQLMALDQFFSELTNLTEVDLSGVTVNNTNATSLADSLSHLSLSHLVLKRTELNANTLLDWLEDQQSSLESLKLSSAYLYGGEQWPALPELNQLAIIDSVIDRYFYDNFTDWLNSSQVEWLRLNQIDLSPYDLSPFFRDADITALDLSSCMLTDYSLKAPIEEHLEDSSITSLDLSDNLLDYFGEDVQFPNTSNLKAIALGANDFTSGITTIINMIDSHDITYLDLSMARFHPEDRAELFQTLTNSSSIRHLYLAGMDLTDAELENMLDNWQGNKTRIETLDLSSNSDLSNTSLSLLMEQACSLYLNTLLLTGTDLSQQINATAWAQLLSGHCNLLSLNIERSQASDGNFRSLMRGLTTASPLKQLNLAENAFNHESWHLAASTMLRVPSFMRGITQAGNWDYNHGREQYCSQNNNLETLVLSNSGLSGDNLELFCENLNVFEKLNLSAVGFGSTELRQSANIQVPGCPAAIGTISNNSFDYRVIYEISPDAWEYCVLATLVTSVLLLLTGLITTGVSTFCQRNPDYVKNTCQKRSDCAKKTQHKLSEGLSICCKRCTKDENSSATENMPLNAIGRSP